jgi:hypothetical protein
MRSLHILLSNIRGHKRSFVLWNVRVGFISAALVLIVFTRTRIPGPHRLSDHSLWHLDFIDVLIAEEFFFWLLTHCLSLLLHIETLVVVSHDGCQVLG